MSKKLSPIVARRRSLPTKQSPYNLLTLIFILGLIVSACTPQVASTPISVQATPIIQSSVQISTFTPSPASVRINASSKLEQTADQVQWMYALVAPFPTVTDGITSEELHLAWTQATAPADFSGHSILMDESTLAALTALWDEPAPGAVRIVAPDRLLEEAWSELGSWAIVPFEALQPKWKVLTVDGQSPIRKNFDITKYPLVAYVDP